ncbi:uncharacterized protein LOC135146347 [Zophobas morio]|uniref:uncharacterized protein LOC135146347 n=1 Tax=Zophobas morio TaxID=2755281 RepID=UPI003083DD85
MSCAAVDSPEKFERETDFQLATNEEGAVVYWTGKSTLARALSHLLDLDWINQDNCGNARNYHRRISTNQNPKGLIADKCHHLAQHRVKLFRALSPTDALVLIIIQSPRDEDTLTHTAALAFERIKLRGLGHTSLIDHKTARHVIGRFARELEPFTSEELSKASLVIHLDPRLDSLSLLMQLLKELKKICREIQSFTKEEMESALKSSSEYEKNLAKRNTSLYKIVYYSLELDEESNGAIREHIPPLVKNLVTGCTFPKDFHITLLHDEDKSIPPSQKKLLEERLEREA